MSFPHTSEVSRHTPALHPLGPSLQIRRWQKPQGDGRDALEASPATRAAGARGPGTHLGPATARGQKGLPQDAAAQALALPVNMTTLLSAPRTSVHFRAQALVPEPLGGVGSLRTPQLLLREGQGPTPPVARRGTVRSKGYRPPHTSGATSLRCCPLSRLGH